MGVPNNSLMAKAANVLRYPIRAAELIAAEGPVPTTIQHLNAEELGTRNNVLRYPRAAAMFIRDVVLAESSSSSS
jgi:hypothetical protein